MTAKEFLARQLRHITWADNVTLTAAATVPSARFGETFGFGFGSVHATLVHMLSAPEAWLDRLVNDADPGMRDPASLPTIDAIGRQWAVVHDGWANYLDKLREEALYKSVDVRRRGTRFRTTYITVISHVFDHATHHRGQLNSLIKLAGGTPGDYGQMTWARATGETTQIG